MFLLPRNLRTISSLSLLLTACITCGLVPGSALPSCQADNTASVPEAPEQAIGALNVDASASASAGTPTDQKSDGNSEANGAMEAPKSIEKTLSKDGTMVRGALSEHWQEDGKHYNLACSPDSVFRKSDERILVLDSGTFLIESESPITLKTPMSVIHLRSKSTVLVKVRTGQERTYVLLETAHVVTDHHTASLRFGEEALVTDHAPFRGELAGESDVGLRQLRVFELENNRKMVTMEYSLVQAMEREQLLGQIVHSNHQHDKFLREKLMKCAAVLNMVTSKHGQYAGGY